MADVPEHWFADGLDLTNELVSGIESYDGLFTGSSLIATDISVPMRDGEIPGTARLSPGGFTLHLWMGGNSRSQAEANWERLLNVVMKRHRLVRWLRKRPDGTTRECYGRVVGRIAPTPIGRLGMRAQIEVAIPSGTWRNTSDADTGYMPLQSGGPLLPVNWYDDNPGGLLNEDQVPLQGPAGPLANFNYGGPIIYAGNWLFGPTTHTFTRNTIGPGPLDRLVELPGFAGATAPLTGLRVDVSGTIENLVLSCPETGSWLKYDLTLADGQDLWVDAAADIVTAPRVDAVRYKGPYMVEAIPPDNLTEKPVLRVQGTNVGLGAKIRVRGRRLYQTM